VVLTYLDSSVALAHLFAEARQPRPDIWDRRLISSRLLEFEIWTRVYARGGTTAMSNSACAFLSGMELLEMSRETLARALSPFPVHVRTLDGLHLATMHFLVEQGDAVELASYDNRLVTAAAALGIPIAQL
jgi:hypothetical protein